MEPFNDRADAGRQLARALEHLRDRNPVAVGLARGGVVVAAEVAKALHCPLEVLVARKIGAPRQPEYGIGAIAPGGEPVYDRAAIRHLGIDDVTLDAMTQRE